MRGRLAAYLHSEFSELGRRGVQVVRCTEDAEALRCALESDVKNKLSSPTGILLQSHGAGQWETAWNCRIATLPVWTRLYDTTDLISSFDGLTLVDLPHQRALRGDLNEHGEPSWFHRDQRPANENLADTIQGMLALSDVDDGDYSTIFYVPRGEHETAQEMTDAYHARFHRRTTRAGRAVQTPVYDDTDYYAYTDEEMDWLRTHCRLYKPKLRAGDLLLWCSAMPHAAAVHPTDAPTHARVGAFVAMMPKRFAHPLTLQERRSLAKSGLTSTHNVLAPHLFPYDATNSRRSCAIDISCIAVKEARRRLIG